jgi:hypothetical protein
MSLSLNCLVFGDEEDKIFTVKIPKTENVSILKDRIKEKKASLFNHVDASDLDLWKVDLRELGPGPVRVNLDSCPKLSPRKKLSSVFNDTLDDQSLHIIVKASGTSH